MAASKIDSCDTPRRLFLKRGVRQLSDEVKLKNKKLKLLQQTARRQSKKIASLKSIIHNLQKKNLINDEATNTLLESFGKHSDLITNWANKNAGKPLPRKYSPALRQFALSLHFFSVKAYAYVRKEFSTILPHPRTLSKWYSHMHAEPGFTHEALKTLSLKVKHSAYPVYCSLMVDEMAIRQHLEYDGNKYYGQVNLGNGMNNDCLDIAKECFVFMVVAVNEDWKIPIGYFLTSSLNSSQKCELLKHALSLLKETGINIISLTFDGCSSNITMAKLLGCNFNISTLDTTFVAQSTNNNNTEVAVFFDPAHMIKLVRNAFGEKKIFMDGDNQIVDFSFIQKLCVLQETEGAHLANKLRKQNIHYHKQKMKVKLATQLISQSVADALKFLKNNLCLPDFLQAGATIKFIEMFNAGFDILNSRSANCIGKKKLCVKKTIKKY